jgi:hypothetical protein
MTLLLPSVHYLGQGSSNRDILSLRMSVGKIKFVVGAASLADSNNANERRVLVFDSPDELPAYRGLDVRVQTDVLIGLLLLSPRASVNNSLRGQAQNPKKKKKKKKVKNLEKRLHFSDAALQACRWFLAASIRAINRIFKVLLNCSEPSSSLLARPHHAPMCWLPSATTLPMQSLPSILALLWFAAIGSWRAGRRRRVCRRQSLPGASTTMTMMTTMMTLLY